MIDMNMPSANIIADRGSEQFEKLSGVQIVDDGTSDYIYY
jgi:hypothetical protein